MQDWFTKADIKRLSKLIKDNNYHHIKKINQALYLDGVEVTVPLKGNIGEVRMFNKQLSPQEISKLKG